MYATTARVAGTAARTTRGTIAAGTCVGCGYVNALQDETRRTRSTRCGGCGHRVRLDYVTGEHNGARPCDDRCQYATREFCSCNCGGENHRRGYIAPPEQIPVWVRDRDRHRHAAKRARKAEKVARQQRDRDAERAAGRAALLTAHPTLAALESDRYAGRVDDRFVTAMRAALADGDMTPRMVEATLRMIDRDTARDADRAAEDARRAALAANGVRVPTGRHTFTATIVRVIWREAVWPARVGTSRMLVRHADGWEAWGNMPADMSAAIMGGPLYVEACDRGLSPRTRIAEGHTVRLTAQLSPAKDGGTGAGNFTRPTGAVLDPDATADTTTVARPTRPRPAPVAPVGAEPAATLTVVQTPGYGRAINRPTRIVARTEPVTIVGPVPFEPSMVRVRRADGTVIRASRDDITPAEPAPVAVSADPWAEVDSWGDLLGDD